MQLQVQELQNLITIARRFTSQNPEMESQEAQVIWQSINNTEQFIKSVVDAQDAQDATAAQVNDGEESTSTLTVVDVVDVVDGEDSSCNEEDSSCNGEE